MNRNFFIISICCLVLINCSSGSGTRKSGSTVATSSSSTSSSSSGSTSSTSSSSSGSTSSTSSSSSGSTSSTSSSSSGSTSSTSSSGGESTSSTSSSSSGSTSSTSSSGGGSSSGGSAPTSTSISINSNASYSTSASVTLSLSATNADQMYITNTLSCLGDGVWESYASSKNWSLSSSDGAKGVYVKFRDSFGVESDCINDSITLDTQSPSKASALSLLTPSTSPNNITQPVIQVDGVVEGDTVELFKNDSSCGAGNLLISGVVASGQSILSLQSTSLIDGSYTFHAKTKDPAGNSLGCSDVSVAYNLDTVSASIPSGLNLGSTSVVGSESPILSWTDSTDSGGSGVASYQVQIYSSSHVAIGSPATLVSGNKITDLNLTTSESYYFKVRAIDNAGNISSFSAASDSWTALAADVCAGTPSIGTQCTGGALYAGIFGGNKYMIPPSGCTNSATPTCAGGTDTVTKTWNSGSGYWYDISGVENVADAITKSSVSNLGDVNTGLIAAITETNSGGIHQIAKYCSDMVYGGYSDWYLPSKSELAYIFCHSFSPNGGEPDEDASCSTYGGKTSELTGFANSYYASSTEKDSAFFWAMSLNGGAQYAFSKHQAYYFRCVRRY